MSKKKLRFAIFGNEYQAKKSQAIHKIIAILQQYEAEIIIDRPFYKFITEVQKFDMTVNGVLRARTLMLISLFRWVATAPC